MSHQERIAAVNSDGLGIRKVLTIRERTGSRQFLRIASLAVVANPAAGRDSNGPFAGHLADLGERLGRRLIGDVSDAGRIQTYGKGALVGVAGDVERAAAIIHPRLGGAVRAAIPGATAIMCSTVKIASAGAAIDVPLAHIADPWKLDYLDTMTVSLADAPLPDEIVVIVAAGVGPRSSASQ